MGSNASATLFYGICAENECEYWGNLGRDFDDPDYIEDPADTEWEKVYAQQMGVSEPSAPYDRDNAEVKKLHEDYWDAKRAIAKTSGCDIGTYGCGNGQTPIFVSIEESETRADWEGPTYLKPNVLDVEPEWREKLHKFCKVMGIKWQEPKWCIVVYYG